MDLEAFWKAQGAVYADEMDLFPLLENLVLKKRARRKAKTSHCEVHFYFIIICFCGFIIFIFF